MVMHFIRVVIFGLLIVRSCSTELNFPNWFKFGAATSAYQIEGGWNASDKGESIWDKFSHSLPHVIAKGATGDVACDSYHLWRRDIEMAKELGLDVYRFSISWSRLLPNGFANHISEDGKRYYNELIDGLLEKGIEPVVTLYHFDLPQIFEDLGGWANPLIAEWFTDYARVAYSLFGDRVKIWLTINEPFGTCELGYSKQFTPYLQDMKIGRFLCNKYSLIAHAKAWRLYDDEYRRKHKGKVSLASIFCWFEPATPDDVELVNLAIEYWDGRYSYPIFSKTGGWPPAIEILLAERAKQEGYQKPWLLPFTPEEIELVRGTYDFYGLNHYTSRLVRKPMPGEQIGSWPFYGSDEIGAQFEMGPSWEQTSLTGLHFPAIDFCTNETFSVGIVYPEGLYKQLHWLNQTYGVKEILITENGYVDTNPHLRDWERLQYIKKHLEKVQLAIADGLNVTGYITWTLMDNMEWFAGYSVNFGLYAVDFNDPHRTRTPRDSARFYSNVTRNRSLQFTQGDLNNAL